MAGGDLEVTEDRAVGATETPTPTAATEATETPTEDTEAAMEVDMADMADMVAMGIKVSSDSNLINTF